MTYRKMATAMLLVLAGSPALAQGFTGAEVNLEYQSFSNEDAEIDATAFSAGLEFGITRSISVAADFSVFNPGEDEDGADGESPTSVTLHGMYHLSDAATVGLFYGRDSVADDSLDYYGVEAGYETGSFEIGGYYGQGDDDGIEFGVFGLDAAYYFGSFAVTGALSSAGTDGFAIATAEIGGRYAFNETLDVYAEMGSVGIDYTGDAEVDADANYVGLGVTMTVGADRGTTFNARSVATSLYGF